MFFGKSFRRILPLPPNNVPPPLLLLLLTCGTRATIAFANFRLAFSAAKFAHEGRGGGRKREERGGGLQPTLSPLQTTNHVEITSEATAQKLHREDERGGVVATAAAAAAAA